MYHTLRSPRSRCPHSESGPLHGCLHMKPDGPAAPQKTPKALAPKSPCRAHPPLQCSHNSLTQTCTSGPHLQKRQQQKGLQSVLAEKGFLYLKFQEVFLTHQWRRRWSRPRTPPVGWPSPVASPPFLAADTRPDLHAPAGPPSWLRLAHSEVKVQKVSL